MKQIIKRILREQFDSNYLEKVSNILIQSGPPYFKMMEDNFNVTDENDQLEVMKYIYGNDISIKYERRTYIYNKGENPIYSERKNAVFSLTSPEWEITEYDLNDKIIKRYDSEGSWEITDYDLNGNEIYTETSEGNWWKWEFDSKNNLLYHEDSSGYWVKHEYDQDGNEIYFVTSDGYWLKTEYDKNNREIYVVDVNGVIKDYRKKN
jgi:hypothetical protein